MKVRYTFDVRGQLQVEPGLVFLYEGYEFEFLIQKSSVRALRVTIPNTPEEHWPAVLDSMTSDAKLTIDAREPSEASLVERNVMNLAGLLAPYGIHGIDTDRLYIDWIPETEEEKDKLKITSFSRLRPDEEAAWHLQMMPNILPTDMVARCILAAAGSTNKQIPLTFFSRGREDLFYERYIEAYYDFYFIIETMFANGKTDKKKVIKELEGSSLLCDCISTFFNSASHTQMLKEISITKFDELVAVKSHNKLFEHIVDTRGRLHHHSLKQSNVDRKWHPAKQKDFSFDAKLLHSICYEICMKLVLDEMYAERLDINEVKIIFRKPEVKGRIRFLCSFAQGFVQLHNQEKVIEVEGDIFADGTPSHRQLAEAERKFFAWFAATKPRSYLISYISGPADGSEGHYSEYRACLPA